MRAFQFSCLSWIATILLLFIFGNQTVALGAALASTALTSIWFAHIVAFSTRIHEAVKSGKEFDTSRRKLFSLMIRTAAATAIAGMSANTAFADNTPCPVVTCGNNLTCCTKNCGGGKTGHHCCTYNDCYNGKCIVPC
jgi:hypothetical protein